jgi:hypothetical protein
MAWWKSFNRKVRKAIQLSARDWLTLTRAWGLLLGFRVALRFTALKRLEEFACRAILPAPVSAEALIWARHTQGLVSLAAQYHLPPMTCLPRALALCRMASRRGLPVQLRLGMSKTSA